VDSMGRRAILSGEGQQTAEVLQQFVAFFAGKGWLNRRVSIRTGGVPYLLFCDEKKFLAYRMNDNWGIPPGAPGWPVCQVTCDRLFDDRKSCALPSGEPGPREWLRRLIADDFEVT